MLFHQFFNEELKIILIFEPVLAIELGLGLATEFRSEKIPRNRLGMDSVIPQKKVVIPKHSEVYGRANSEARNGME
jgi:hypothetical protein